MDIHNKFLQSSKESLLSTLNAVKSARDELKHIRNELSPSKNEQVVKEICDLNGIIAGNSKEKRNSHQ